MLFGKGLKSHSFQDQPITRRQILDSSKLKEFADHNFKLDKNGSKLSKWVENTVGKGVIACYEQFLLFPQCFQKAHFPGASKGIIMWEWVKTKGSIQILLYYEIFVQESLEIVTLSEFFCYLKIFISRFYNTDKRAELFFEEYHKKVVIVIITDDAVAIVHIYH